MIKPEPFAILKLTAISALLFSFIYAFVPLRFTENDDVVMMLLASGRYTGEPSANLVFINFYLSSIISYLYEAIPMVEWYPVTLLLVICISLSIPISLFICRILNGTDWGLLKLTTLLIAASCCIISMQFTTVAAISASMGVWSILSTRKVVYVSLGVFLVLISFLIRFEAAVLSLIISAPLTALAIKLERTSLKQVSILIVTILAAFIIHKSGENVYKSLNEEYFIFNKARGKINDNPNSNISADNLPNGISENDYWLLLNFFPDPEQFDTENIQNIRDAVTAHGNRAIISNWIRVLQNTLNRPEVYLLASYIIILSVANLSISKSTSIITISCGPFFILPFLYVGANNAILTWRIVLSVCIAILVAIFFLNINISNRPLRFVSKFVLAAAAFKFLTISYDRLEDNVSKNETFRKQSEIISEWGGRVYAFKNNYKIDGAQIFSPDFDIFSREIFFAGWMTKHPGNSKFSSFLDLLDQDSAVFFFNRDRSEAGIRRIQVALEENYNTKSDVQIILENDNGLLVGFRGK